MIENNNEYGFSIDCNYSNSRYLILSIILRYIIAVVFSISTTYILTTTINIDINIKNIVISSLVVGLICVPMILSRVVAFIEFAIGLLGVAYISINNMANIKLGLIAIVNNGYDIVRNSMDLPYVDGFDKIIGQDCSNQINLVVMLLCILTIIITMFLVGRFMSVVYTYFVTFLIIGYSIYLENLKSIYPILFILVCAIIVTYVKFSKTNNIRLLKKYRFNIKDNGIILSQIFVISILIFCITNGVISAVFSQELFDNTIKQSSSKDNFKYVLKDMLVLKYAEYKDFKVPSNTDVGQLGLFSCVNIDDDTKYFVYTDDVDNDKLFLRNFIGANYVYRGNNWNSKVDLSNINQSNSTAKALKDTDTNIRNIDFVSGSKNGFSSSIYVPYYTDITQSNIYNYIDDCNIDSNINDKKYSVDIYKDDNITIDDSQYYQYALDNYTNIDNRSIASIDTIIKNANINSSDSNIEDELKNYFKNNYDYSFDNEVVPYGNDFIDYFLNNTKTGNFAHFASTATLVYRRLGIPARYVGGYAIDKEQILSGKYNQNTGKFEVKISSANMYAWVELYQKGFGWKPIDIAPAPSYFELVKEFDNNNKKEEINTHKDILQKYFEPIKDKYYNPLNLKKTAQKLFVAVVVIFVLILLFKFVLYKLILNLLWNIKYNKAENDVKAFMLMNKLKLNLNISDIDYSSIKKVAIDRGYSIKDINKIINIANRLVFSNTCSEKDIKLLENMVSKIK